VRVAAAFRIAAIAVAVAALIDPTINAAAPVRQSLTIAVLETPGLLMPTRDEQGLVVAQRIAQGIRSDLEDVFIPVVRKQPADASAEPCPVSGACIVISDGTAPKYLSSRMLALGGVRVTRELTPNVSITRVIGAPHDHESAAAALMVDLTAAGVAGERTDIDVFDDGVLVGRSSHTWKADTDSVLQRVTLPVEWTPVRTGVRQLRVVASTVDRETTAADNEVVTAIDIDDGSDVVMFIEPQPTWMGTFVRRSLEADHRFRLLADARVSRNASVGSSSQPLRKEVLIREDVKAVVVTSANLLTTSDVNVLDAFVRSRGGSLILLVDGALTGAIRRLAPITVSPHQRPTPLAIGSLTASEFVTFGREAELSVLARAGDQPVVVSRATGEGRVVFFGASDAWRYRDRENGFSAYWRSLVADAAEATADSVVVTLSSNAARVGEELTLRIAARTLGSLPATTDATASLDCNAASTPIRLWPDGKSGRYVGHLTVHSPGRCRVHARIEGLPSASAPLVVMNEPIGNRTTSPDELATAVAAYGGIFVESESVAALVAKFRQSATREQRTIPLHPMRSPWWMVPFAACLGGEWFLRRRKGLR
jgi:hypothetical protein